MFKSSDFPEKDTKNKTLENSLLGELEGALAKRKQSMKKSALDSDSDDDLLDFLKKDKPQTMVSETKTKSKVVKSSILDSSDSDSG